MQRWQFASKTLFRDIGQNNTSFEFNQSSYWCVIISNKNTEIQ